MKDIHKDKDIHTCKDTSKFTQVHMISEYVNIVCPFLVSAPTNLNMCIGDGDEYRLANCGAVRPDVDNMCLLSSYNCATVKPIMCYIKDGKCKVQDHPYKQGPGKKLSCKILWQLLFFRRLPG